MFSATTKCFLMALIMQLIDGKPLDSRKQLLKGKYVQHFKLQYSTHINKSDIHSKEHVMDDDGDDRVTVPGYDSLWRYGIVPYTFNPPPADDVVAQKVRDVMDHLSSISCVVFKELGPNKKPSGAYLEFVSGEKLRECDHDPKIENTHKVSVVLGYNCMSKVQLLHTVLHGLGLKDEIRHPRRDQYVRVMWPNIIPKYRHLYRMDPEFGNLTGSVEYDPLSIMHFHDHAFTSNAKETLSPLVPGLTVKPSDDLSQLDRMKLRMMFSPQCNKREVQNLLAVCVDTLYEHSQNNNDDEDRPESSHEIDTDKEGEKTKEKLDNEDGMLKGEKDKKTKLNLDNGDRLLKGEEKTKVNMDNEDGLLKGEEEKAKATLDNEDGLLKGEEEEKTKVNLDNDDGLLKGEDEEKTKVNLDNDDGLLKEEEEKAKANLDNEDGLLKGEEEEKTKVNLDNDDGLLKGEDEEKTKVNLDNDDGLLKGEDEEKTKVNLDNDDGLLKGEEEKK